MLLLAAGSAHAQTTYSWRNEASNGSWSESGNWWRGYTETPSGSEILRFDNGVQTTMTNDLSATNRYRIFFDGGSASRVIGGSTENTFYDFGGNIPKIENLSASTQTLNFPIKLGYVHGLELNPVNGDLVIGGAIDTNGNYLKVYGDNGKSLTLGAAVSGGGGIDVNQNSRVILSGANSYSGATTVNAGILQVDGDQSAASGSVLVAQGARLAGSGTVGGNTTVNGTHGVGAAAGAVASQRFVGNLSYGATSVFEWDLNGNSISSGFDSVERTSAGGTLSVDGAAVFQIVIGDGVDFSGSFWESDRTWGWSSIFANFASIDPFSSFAVVNGGAEAGYGSFSVDPAGVQWTALSSVPEPGSAIAGLLVLCGLTRRRRESARG
ncbi:autotransporter-associated beta strand repeat-containing protein [Luteolibacter marinus]|uniref:autotransporter-associated beta strand repeat-containing protein n=1 Tax=Luteolibacter marinus TaxID=2776705 RepID=UPI0018667110|nr:autotransporter-associated beta strand repeat-containing protein [Luteolibacter marinus]